MNTLFKLRQILIATLLLSANLFAAEVKYHSASAGAKKVLKYQGYIANEKMPVPQELLDGLLGLDWQDFAPATEGGIHKYATSNYYQVQVNTSKREMLLKQAVLTPQAVEDFAVYVVNHLPKGNYECAVVLFDDLGNMEQGLQDLRQPTARIMPVLWHQDKNLEKNYNYLYFLVLEVAGIREPPELHLGLAGRPNLIQDMGIMNSHDAKPVLNAANKNVELLASVRGTNGSGYLINQEYADRQNRLIVHRHTGFSAHPMDPSQAAQTKPTRKKVVVRISKIAHQAAKPKRAAPYCLQ